MGACHGIPHYVHTYHITKPLIVTDKGIVNTGILKIITDILDGDNIPYSIYDKTVPNPTDENVTEGVAQYKADGCDGLISIGGGSSHDCCKGIGILLSNGGAIYQYEGVDKVNHMLPHYIAINTTAGTASELTRFCVITDKERHVKMSIVDWFLTPNVAVNDPVLMVGMPPSLTAATGMDALTHAIEAYVSTNTTPMTDACAEQSIRLVASTCARPWPTARTWKPVKAWPTPNILPGWPSTTPVWGTCTRWRISLAASTACPMASATPSFCRMWSPST